MILSSPLSEPGAAPEGLMPRRAKRGQGRFYGACQFNFETLNIKEQFGLFFQTFSGLRLGPIKIWPLAEVLSPVKPLTNDL